MGAQKYSAPLDDSYSDSDVVGAGQDSGLVFRPGRAARVSLILTAVISLACVGAVVGGGMFLSADMSGREKILMGFTALGWMCVTVSSGIIVFARSLPPQETWMWSQTSCIVIFFVMQWAGCFTLTAALAWDVFYPVWISNDARVQDQHLAGAVQFLGLVISLASTAFVSFDLKSHVYVALLITRECEAAVVRFTPTPICEKPPYGYSPPQTLPPSGNAPFAYPPPPLPSAPVPPSTGAAPQWDGAGASADANAPPTATYPVAGTPMGTPRSKPSSQGLAGMPNRWMGPPANAFGPASSEVQLAEGHEHERTRERKHRHRARREQKERESARQHKADRSRSKRVASGSVNLNAAAGMTSTNMMLAS